MKIMYRDKGTVHIHSSIPEVLQIVADELESKGKPYILYEQTTHGVELR